MSHPAPLAFVMISLSASLCYFVCVSVSQSASQSLPAAPFVEIWLVSTMRGPAAV